MIDLLKHTVVNVCKSVTYRIKKPDKKFFECIFESMLEYHTTVLSALGDTKQKKAKDLLKYFSQGLEREGFTKRGTIPETMGDRMSISIRETGVGSGEDRTHDIHKTDHLVALVQLCLGVSAYIHNKLNPIHEFGQEKKTVTTTFFSKYFSVFLREKGLKVNRNSIYALIGEHMKKVGKMKYFFKRSILKPLVSSQGKLDFEC